MPVLAVDYSAINTLALCPVHELLRARHLAFRSARFKSRTVGCVCTLIEMWPRTPTKLAGEVPGTRLTSGIELTICLNLPLIVHGWKQVNS
jgi:hypothetical protein